MQQAAATSRQTDRAGLEAVARAYAKIIDRVNEVDREDLQRSDS